MASQDPKIDNLHQKASAQYLQGEFQAALATWRELLQLDPEDDRALEGVKLCEMLAENERAPASPESNPAQAEPPASATSIEGFDDDLEELDAILDGGPAARPVERQEAPASDPAEMFNFKFGDPDPQKVDNPAAPLPGSQQSQGQNINLSDVGTGETFDFGASDQRPHGVHFDFNPQSLDLPENDAGKPETGASPSETAAAELRHRVRELLSEAQSLLDAGDREGALAVLNRIDILDENNEAALGLRELIKTDIATEERQAAAAIEPEAPPARALDFDFTEVPADGGETELDAMPVVAASLETDSAMAPAIEAEAPVEFAEEPQKQPQPSIELAVGMRKPSLMARLTGPKLAIAGGLLAVVAIGGFSAYWLVWGPGASSGSNGAEGDAATAAAAGPISLERERPKQGLQKSEKQKPPENEARAPKPVVDLEALAAQANEAYRRGDYADAVLFYNQLLEADPNNTQAKSRLADAGERYRAKKELEDKRAEAFEDFNNGNYRAALTIFYRMPEGEDQARLQRYERNGWYNMGLQALTTGDCETAKTNFKEAQALDPADKEVTLALDLTRVCRYSRGEDSYRQEVMAMTFRGLDD